MVLGKKRLEVSNWGVEEFAKKMPEQWKDDEQGAPSMPERLLDAAVRARRAENNQKGGHSEKATWRKIIGRRGLDWEMKMKKL